MHVTAGCFSHAGSNGTVIIAITAAIVILMIVLVITPVILVCLFKQWLQHTKTNQLDFTSEDPTSLTPCTAYGVHTHGGSTLPAEYKVPSLAGSDPLDPEYEMISCATTGPHSVPGTDSAVHYYDTPTLASAEPQYEVITQAPPITTK